MLDNDIYLNDISDFDNWLTQIPQYQWKPINGRFGGFQGSFDGQGHSIYGMYIYKSDIESDSIYTGLFAKTKDAEIKNLNILENYLLIVKLILLLLVVMPIIMLKMEMARE